MVAGMLRQVVATADVRQPGRMAPERTRHYCVGCRERRSLFAYGGVVKADADHTLCFRCFRRLRDSVRAHQAKGVGNSMAARKGARQT